MTAAWVVFAATWIASVGACSAARRALLRYGFLDHPNERSSHEHPIPRGGGVGIVLALAAGVVAGSGWFPSGLSSTGLATIGLAAGGLAVLGAWDDRWGVPVLGKLAIQLPAAVLVVVGVGAVREVALPGAATLPFGALGPVLTVVWLVSVSNGFNFMDGIDGIAGLFAGIAGLFFSGAAVLAGAGGLLWLSIPLAAASLGFLALNWHPAKVFMGDVGSLPLGFLLALLAVLGNAVGVPFVAGFLILGPFLFDTAFTLFVRLVGRENIFAAHRSHLYQRLVLSGWSHVRVSLFYGGWTVLTGVLGLLYLHESPVTRAAVLLVAAASGLAVVLLVGRRERNVGAIR